MIIVQAMARNRKDVDNILTSYKTRELIEHLIRLAVFDSPDNKNHWRTEVYSLLNAVPLMKHNKRPPDKKFMFNAIWSYYGDNLVNLTKSVFKQEPNEKVKQAQNTATDIEIKVKAYIDWLTTELSKTASVDKNDVYAELDALGL